MAEAPKNDGAFWETEEDEAKAMAAELGEDPNIFAEPEPAPPAAEAPPAETPPAEEPPAETPPAETPPAAEAPPAETPPAETPPAAEAKPTEEKKPKGDGWAWRELRRLQREKKAEEAAKAQPPAPAPVAETPPGEEEILDPIEKVLKVAEEAKEEARKARERAEAAEKQFQVRTQEQEILSTVERQVSAFKSTHDDYDQAAEYVVQTRLRQLERIGTLDAEAENWLEKRPDLVERHAMESGLNPEDYNDIRKAAKDMAGKIAIYREEQQLKAVCAQTNKNFAETLYGLAEDLGHKRQVAAPVVPPKVEPTPQQRVQAAKQQAERQKPFTQSISAMSPNPAPAPKPITTKEELMNRQDPDIDKLVEEMDEKDPSMGWLDRLG